MAESSGEDIKSEVYLAAGLEEIWKQLHAMPEPAFCELRTSAFLAAQLCSFGYEVAEHVGMNGEQQGTGVVAVYDSGKPGPVVALRSDMDCLMFRQSDGSEIGIHACGHDAHMSMVLLAAKLLADDGISCGKVKIIYQPAEEIGKGALSLLEAGALDDVDCLFGIHLMSSAMAPSGKVIASVRWTACTLIEAVIEGVAAHGSKPHLGINAIDAGAAVVNAINALHTDPLLCGNVKTTRFLAGGASLNSICNKAELGFDLRSTSNAEMLQLRQRVAKTVEAVAGAYGATAITRIVGTCPASEIDDTMAAIARQAIIEELGQDGLIEAAATTVGEDFNFYPMYKAGLRTGFIGLGCDLQPGLHDPEMHFKHQDMVHGTRILVAMVRKALENLR